MPESEQPSTLGLNTPAPKPVEVLPPVESLQFRRAEHAPAPSLGPQCAACKQPTGSQFFQANGITLCERCMEAMKATQRNPPAGTLLKALLYGSGAALAGCILYATVAITTGLELALISILIGYMVGRAIRYASSGGRPQQIMAVALTYLSISTSYVPVAVYHISHEKPEVMTAAKRGQAEPARIGTPANSTHLVIALLGLAVAAPFLVINGTGGILTLVIIFFGLQRAWRLTGRPDILFSGPFSSQAAS